MTPNKGRSIVYGLRKRVFDANLGGGQRLGALAGLAGKLGAIDANQAAYGLQAGNLSAPFGAWTNMRLLTLQEQ